MDKIEQLGEADSQDGSDAPTASSAGSPIGAITRYPCARIDTPQKLLDVIWDYGNIPE